MAGPPKIRVDTRRENQHRDRSLIHPNSRVFSSGMDSVPSNYDNTLSFTIFSDPVDPFTVEPIPAITPSSPPDIPNSGRTLDDGLRGLEVIVRHPLRPQQQEALTELDSVWQ